MDTIDRTVLYLEEVGIIPKEGIINISEDILMKYIEIYSMFSKGNGKYSFNYARKLAGLTLLKTNRLRGGTYTTIKEGLVYIIINPAWSEYFKVGMTIDLDDRLKSYQTYSPLKDFKVDKYNFTLNRREDEKELLKLASNSDTEWVSIKYKPIIEEFINNIGK
jgi:hypothetical protein